VKNYAQASANQNGGTQYPADVNQSVPGFFFNTETGFLNGPFADPVMSGLWPAATPHFPSIRGLDMAGKVDSGTRVYLKFSPVSPGVKLFVPVTLSSYFGSTSTTLGSAVLIGTDSNGAGIYGPVAGNSAGLAALTVTNGVAMAVYEFTGTNINVLENLRVPVAIAYTGQPPAGIVNVEYGFGPLSNLGTADVTSPIPRFTALGNTLPEFTIQACTASLTASPNPVNLTGTTGQPSPQQSVQILATSGSVNWTAAPSAAWLSVSPVSGTASSTSSASVTITATPGKMAPGTYTGSATITPTSGSSLVVPVNFTVLGAPVWSITLTHSGIFRPGQANATYTITVSNIGNADSSPTNHRGR
jgi:hypothetical protein